MHARTINFLLDRGDVGLRQVVPAADQRSARQLQLHVGGIPWQSTLYSEQEPAVLLGSETVSVFDSSPALQRCQQRKAQGVQSASASRAQQPYSALRRVEGAP